MAEVPVTLRTGARLAAMFGALLVALVVALVVGSDSARAIEIHAFSAEPTLSQAGGHPDLTIVYSGETHDDRDIENPCKCNDPRDIDISLPTGFIGNPHATPRCKAADFARNLCPADSQIGVITATVSFGPGGLVETAPEAVYNSIPRPNQAGLLSMAFLPEFFTIPFYTALSARTGTDYGLDANSEGVLRYFVPQKFTITIWGVPADSSHDAQRVSSNVKGISPWPSNSPRIPFLINPGTCNTSPSSTLKVIGYDGSVNSTSYPWPTSIGCDQLTFNPSLSAKPTTTAADSASGVDVDLTVPQLLSPSYPSPSEIRATTLTLPVGFSINPNAADGKTSCTDSAAGFGTKDEAQCPEFSKIGTDVIDSPALPAPIEGGIYLGQPLPENRYRIFLTGDGFATHVKLAGVITPDPQTGQVTTTFNNLPQSPLTEFRLHFFGAERGVLATPTQCGKYAVHSTFTPWDEELSSQSATQFFELDSGPDGAPCPEPTRHFGPTFSASSSGNTAGAHSPFTVDLQRNDGDQNMSGLTVTTPPGFTASLAGIPYCSDAALTLAASLTYSGLLEQISPSCPAASQIGTSSTGAGAGSRPVHLPGKVYLAGPYKGAPLSLAVITPAVSGPYDLGNVVVRAALHVDPLDAHVTTLSDPLPQIVDGIPLRLRTVRVSLDRPDFTLNPTNCEPFSVGAAVTGDQGTEVDLASHFQVANCSILPYEPSLSLKLSGGLRRRGHPAIHALFQAKPGEANSRSVSVALPQGELLDNSHFGTVCTKPDFAAEQCPAGSRIGHVVVRTPILSDPLEGVAYLRSSSEGLPDLALKLNGQVDIEAVAKIDSVNEGLRSTFSMVPDVPFSSIKLDLAGGKKGLLQNSESLCGVDKKATAKMIAQNGARRTVRVSLEANCGAGKAKRHLGHARSVG